MTVVPIQTTQNFSAGNPTKLFQTRYFTSNISRTYDVSRDGQKFLMIKDAGGEQTATPATMTVVLNWSEELKTRAGK